MVAEHTVSLPQFDQLMGSLGAPVDFSKPFKVVEQLLASEAKECFRTESDPWRKKWAPLKRPYRYRGGKRTKARILQDTGALRSSVTSAFAAGNVRQRTSTSLTWGTQLPYAGYHQDGTAKIPARPFLGLNDKTMDRIDQVLGDYAADEVARRLGYRL